MALDTADKRASALACGLDARAVRPIPDGSLNGGDRQQVSGLYRGIAASAAPAQKLFLQPAFVVGPSG